MRQRFIGRTPKAKKIVTRRPPPEDNVGEGWSKLPLEEFRPSPPHGVGVRPAASPGPVYLVPSAIGKGPKPSFYGKNISRALPLVGAETPGPGSYVAEHSAVGKQVVSFRSSSPAVRIPKGDRFWESNHTYHGPAVETKKPPETPGPGAYEVPSSFVVPSVTRRPSVTDTPSYSAEQAPGPGWYETAESIRKDKATKVGSSERVAYLRMYDGPGRQLSNPDRTPGFKHNVTTGLKPNVRKAPAFSFGKSTGRDKPSGSLNRSSSTPPARRSSKRSVALGGRPRTSSSASRPLEDTPTLQSSKTVSPSSLRQLAKSKDYSWLREATNPSVSGSRSSKGGTRSSSGHAATIGSAPRFAAVEFTAHRQEIPVDTSPGPRYWTREDLTRKPGSTFGRGPAKLQTSSTDRQRGSMPGPGHYNLQYEARQEEDEVIRELAVLRMAAEEVEAADPDCNPLEANTLLGGRAPSQLSASLRRSASGRAIASLSEKQRAVVQRRAPLLNSLTSKAVSSEKAAQTATSKFGLTSDPMFVPSMQDTKFGSMPTSPSRPAVKFTTGSHSPKLYVSAGHIEAGGISPGPAYDTRSKKPHSPAFTLPRAGMGERGPLPKPSGSPLPSDLVRVQSSVARQVSSTRATSPSAVIPTAPKSDLEIQAFPPGADAWFQGKLSPAASYDVRESPGKSKPAPLLHPYDRKVGVLSKEAIAVPGPGAYTRTKPFKKPKMPLDPHPERQLGGAR